MIEVIRGDITTVDVDAIVNAANERMLGGGGVDGAIHRAAGRGLYEACLALPEVKPGVRCPTGQSRITPGFNLAARYVIHTVGPIWRGGDHGEAELLASCYRTALELAHQHHARSIAFPAISCGIYGYPLDEAAAIAVRETRSRERDFDRIALVAFDGGVYDALIRSVRSGRSDRSDRSGRSDRSRSAEGSTGRTEKNENDQNENGSNDPNAPNGSND